MYSVAARIGHLNSQPGRKASARQNSGAGTLAVEAEVLGTKAPRSRSDRGFLDLAITTRNQNGDELIT